MAIYSISDLHLGLSNEKPMDIFGSRWENYLELLKANWEKTVQPEDIVLVPGDISWATYIDRAEADFRFIHELPGKKLISKGNHDYWWETLSKLKAYIDKMGFTSIHFLHNTIYQYRDVVICGAKGYPDNGVSAEDKKLYNRELSRLQLSLELATAADAEKIFVMLHYPPMPHSDFARLMESYGVKRCLYGHLHGNAHRGAPEGNIGGVEYKLVSADYLQFKPFLLEA